MTAGLIY